MKCTKWLMLSLLLCFSSNSLLQAKCKSKCSSTAGTADYVIVGVGTAGAVLAKKLTDRNRNSVIALHNGKNLNKDPLIKYSKNAPITVLATLLGFNPFDNFTFPQPLAQTIKDFLDHFPQPAFPLYQTGMTIPQPEADNRALLWVLALPEGGSSSINAGAYCRGTNELFSQWEAIAGPLWSVNRILDVYKGLEHYHGKTDDPAARGYHGPISIRQVSKPSGVARKFTEAMINATGLPFVLDYNDPQTPIGISANMQYTQRPSNGIFRVSSGTAFLNSKVMTPKGYGVCGRKLRVHFESTALKTLWDGNKAIGVEYIQHGKTKQVFANKGVIVCAGLFSSPFLLHSGVGPAPLLNSLNIPVVFDNPNVGQGLADQPHVMTLFTSNPEDAPKGIAGQNGAIAQISWLPTPGGDPTERTLRLSTININPFPGITLALLDLCQPKSRGSITINSADPLAPPVINLGVFTDPADLALYQAGFQVYFKALVQAVQTIDPAYQLIFPDPAVLNDIVALTAFIREEVQCTQHFQSHCRMAPQNQGGVVDSTGHVYGVENLIIADNSIAPLCMDGSPMASAYLIGANIARILLNK